MYKILIKHNSTMATTYWKTYEKVQEDGTCLEFETTDVEELKTELGFLTLKYGNENIRAIDDVTYEITIGIPNERVQIASNDDVTNLFETAFARVYSQ